MECRSHIILIIGYLFAFFLCEAFMQNHFARRVVLSSKLDRFVANQTYICVGGRVLPKLQMLGVQKSASTEMFTDLVTTLGLRTDMPCKGSALRDYRVPNFWPCKETQALFRQGPIMYKTLWGRCDTFRDRGVVADFTPDYIHGRNMPGMMAAAYAAERKEIVFVVGLREPIKRMLSAFVSGISGGWIYENEKHPPSFQTHVDDFFRAAHSQQDNWWVEQNNFRTVYQGLYYRNLRFWLDAGYGANQFIVFPGLMYLKHRGNLDGNPVLQAMRARFGSATLRPEVELDLQQKSNVHSHKKLDKLLDEATLERLENDVFGPQNHLLAELLASQKARGMVLVGYEGEAFDTVAVMAWLEENWNF